MTTLVGQPLRWLGGQIDIRVEVDTSFVNEANFLIWNEGQWDVNTWGTEDPDWADITEWVESISINQGKARWEEKFGAGTATVVVSNESGIFTPDAEVPNSPWYLPWRPGRRIRIVAAPFPSLPMFRVPLFTGTIDAAIDQFSQAGFNIVTHIQCVDHMVQWEGHTPPPLETPTGVQRTDERVHAALDRLGWPEELRDIQTGEHSMMSSFLADTTASECHKAAQAEGGAFFCSRDGKATFRARDWLSLDERSTEVQGYIGFPESELPVSLEQLETIDGDSGPLQIVWAKGNFWATDEGDNLYKLDTDFQILDSWDLDALYGMFWCEGITYDGQYLWISTDTNDGLMALDPDDIEGGVKGQIEPNVVDDFGAVGWDGEYFWLAELYGDILYKVNPATEDVDDSFDLGAGVNVRGVAWDGFWLWVMDDSGFIHRVDPSDGSIVTTIEYEGIGLTWDGDHLWTYIGTTDFAKLGLVYPNTAHVLDVKPSWELARIRNHIQLARSGGEVIETEDEASITLYQKRTHSSLDYQNADDIDLEILALRFLAAFKDNRMRVDEVTIAANDDPEGQNLNGLFWNTQLGDLIAVNVGPPYGWSYNRETHVIGITHTITPNDWVVTFKLDDSGVTGFTPTRTILMNKLQPAAWWRFNESGGSTTEDSSGNGHDLTWSGGASLVGTGGPKGTGLVTLDGSNDYATVANEDELKFRQDMSIEAWVRLHTNGLGWIIRAGQSGDALYGLGLSPTRQFIPTISGGHLASFGAGSVNEWVHMVVTIDWHGASRTVRTYVNGVPATSNTYDFVPSDGTRVLTVGRRTVNSGANGDEYLDGDLSELVIYDRVLTSQEILDLYNAEYIN